MATSNLYNNPKQSTVRPFLKWVGSKRSILPALLSRVPKRFKTYHEVFVGSAALHFALRRKDVHLSDVNARLITTYQTVRDNVHLLIKALRIHERKHCKDYFLEARTRLSSETDPVRLASLFIYLNKTCFNGLYRVNKRDEFNVPLGSYANPRILDEDNLKRCSELLAPCVFEVRSFEHTPIAENNFYYLDPPYHQTYCNYDVYPFGEKQHQTVAALCRTMDTNGAYFMQSNSDTPFIRNLYQGFTIETIQARRIVSRTVTDRGTVKELIIRNYSTDSPQQPLPFTT